MAKKTKTFLVIKTAIADVNHNVIQPGQKAELDNELAKHYYDLGYIKPDMPEFDLIGDEDGTGSDSAVGGADGNGEASKADATSTEAGATADSGGLGPTSGAGTKKAARVL